jgi:hypothetical protein
VYLLMRMNYFPAILVLEPFFSPKLNIRTH